MLLKQQYAFQNIYVLLKMHLGKTYVLFLEIKQSGDDASILFILNHKSSWLSYDNYFSKPTDTF